jgi:hypothetical protein
MRFHTSKRRLVLIGLILICAVPPARAATGTIRITGSDVTGLKLKGNGQVYQYNPDAPVMEVPAGAYAVIWLEVGKRFVSTRPDLKVRVPAGGLIELKAGGPLRHNLSITRLGYALRLDYGGITGAAGQQYTALSLDSPEAGIGVRGMRAGFAVSQEGRLIAADQFEYG